MRKIDMFKITAKHYDIYKQAVHLYGETSREAEIEWAYYQGALSVLKAAGVDWDYITYKNARKEKEA